MRSRNDSVVGSTTRPKLSMLLLLACCAATFVQHTAAHSWLECTDYRMDPESADAKTWNPNICHGRARCGGAQMKAKFGQDTGLDQHSAMCQCPRDSPLNTAPVAQYSPGQRVCLAYPPKNHVAAPCTNEYIPDSGVRITRSSVNPTSDDATGTEISHGNGQHQSGQTDYKGFQHCPNFCDSKEDALCTMCFDLERDLTPGNYTFKWIWAFNTVEDVYTTCWEATVGGNGASGNAPNSASNTSTSTPTSEVSSVTTTPAPTPTSASPSSSSSTPSVTPTATMGVAASVSNNNAHNDDDCEDELTMPGGDNDDDCDEELDMAGGVNNEIGGEADPSAPGAPSGGNNNSNGGTSGNTYAGSTPSGPSAHDTPATDGGQGHANGNSNGNGGGPSNIHSNGYGPSQHGYHHKWHHAGHNGGGQQPSAQPSAQMSTSQPPPSDSNTDANASPDNNGGDDTEDPDCELPIANTQAPANVPTDTPSDAVGQGGESANASNPTASDPKVTNGDGTNVPSTPSAPVDNTLEPECEDELSMADATATPSDTPGQDAQGAQPGDSYSFASAAAQSENDKTPSASVNANTNANADTVAGSVLPYPGEY